MSDWTASRLRQAREAMGWSRAEAGARMMVTHLSEYETGDREAPDALLEHMARFYRCSADWLRG